MTTYQDDSFNLYIIFYQGEARKNTFVISSFISWRSPDTLRQDLREVRETYSLSLVPRLLLKIDTTTYSDEPNFDVWNEFKSKYLEGQCVSKNLFFLDEETIKSYIVQYFNEDHSYISVWGDWEDLIAVGD